MYNNKYFLETVPNEVCYVVCMYETLTNVPDSKRVIVRDSEENYEFKASFDACFEMYISACHWFKYICNKTLRNTLHGVYTRIGKINQNYPTLKVDMSLPASMYAY